jgi:hypothetical protein
VSEQAGNVLQVEHHRRDPDLPVGAVEVSLLLEVRDPAHADAIATVLAERGYRRTPGVAGEIRVALEGMVTRPASGP